MLGYPLALRAAVAALRNPHTLTTRTVTVTCIVDGPDTDPHDMHRLSHTLRDAITDAYQADPTVHVLPSDDPVFTGQGVTLTFHIVVHAHRPPWVRYNDELAAMTKAAAINSTVTGSGGLHVTNITVTTEVTP